MSALGCEVVFGEEEGRAFHKMVETWVGGPCACVRGETCPLLAMATGEAFDVTLLAQERRLRRAAS